MLKLPSLARENLFELDPKESRGHGPTHLYGFLYKQGHPACSPKSFPACHAFGTQVRRLQSGTKRAQGSRDASGHGHGDTYPSFSNSPLQSTTEPPVPILSRVCKLTKTEKNVLH